MATNKVILNGTTLIDLSEDNVTAEDVALGVTFHLPNGKLATGTSSGGGAGGVTGGYNVIFQSDGDTYAVTSVKAGQSVTAPARIPQKEGYGFLGWYTEAAGGSKATFPFTPVRNTTFYARFQSVSVLGVSGLASSSTTLAWTNDAADVATWELGEDLTGEFSVMTNSLDDVFPFNQISEFTDDSGNVFVKFPKFWLKWVLNTDGIIDGYKIAQAQVDDEYFIPDAFLNPKSLNDNSVEKYLDYFALGKYEATQGSSSADVAESTSKMYSKSGRACYVNLTRATARNVARAYGTAANWYNGYQQLDFAQLVAYNLLAMLYTGRQSIQTVWGGRTGKGFVTSWSAASVTGTTDNCTALSCCNKNTDCVKLLGIENPYGNIHKWVDGVYFSGVSIYAHRYPQQFADSSTYGSLLEFTRATSSSYIYAMKPGTSADTQSYVYASGGSGTENTYYGDYTYYSSSGTVLYAGGYWNSGANAGLWYLDGSDESSSSRSNIGARLSYRPL